MVRSSRVSSTQSAMRRVVARATSFCTAPWALARGWSVRYWFCLATCDLERRQFRVPSVPHFLRTHGVPPQHVADALLGEHLGQLLIEELHLKGPGAQQFFNLWFGNGGNVMAPMLPEVFDLLALDHAPVADKGDRGSRQTCS